MSERVHFTEEVRARILAALRTSATLEIACASAGVPKRTLNYWRERGAAGEEPHASFLEDCECAMACVEIKLLRRIMRASRFKLDGQWQSAAWLLERRWPERYMKREDGSIGGDGAMKLVVRVSTDGRDRPSVDADTTAE